MAGLVNDNENTMLRVEAGKTVHWNPVLDGKILALMAIPHLPKVEPT